MHESDATTQRKVPRKKQPSQRMNTVRRFLFRLKIPCERKVTLAIPGLT